MKDRWLHDIHDRMSDYEIDEPAGLWGEIEARQAVGRKHFPHLRLIASVAAMIAVVFGLWFLMTIEKHDLSQPVEITAQIVVEEQNPADDESKTVAERIVSDIADKNINIVSTAVRQPGPVEFGTVERKSSTDEALSPDSVTPDAVIEKSGNDVRPTVVVGSQNSEEKNVVVPSISRLKKDYSRFSVALFTSGGLNSNVSDRSLAMQSNGVVAGSNDVGWYDSPMLGLIMSNQGMPIEREIKHRLPVRSGVEFGWRLNDRVTVSTGVTYTMLTSDIREGSDENYYTGQQKLHYLGVPVKVSYKALSWKRLDLYGVAGVLAEKSVSGKIVRDYVYGSRQSRSESETVTVKPLQWSVNASVGLQFNVADVASIFAEPGVSYYFDNGSGIETIYSDKPLNFNLNVGLRFTFGNR